MLLEFDGYSGKVYINPQAVSAVTIGMQDLGEPSANVWIIGTPYPILVRGHHEQVAMVIKGELL